MAEPTPTPTPTPVPTSPAPAPTPTPVPASQAPAPTPVPTSPAPAPTPTPVPQSSAPTPTPVPQSSAPAPTPVPTSPAPAPTPTPVPQSPAPAPSPTPIPTSPAPAPTPVPQSPAPAPTPTPVPASPAPTPTPVPSCSPGTLDAAGKDADANAGQGNVGDPATPCSGAPKAHIAVHVQTTKGDPVKDVTVSVDGQGWAGVTDADGNFDFGDVPPGTYTVKGEKDTFVPSSQTQNAPAGASTQYKLVMDPITVTITLAQPVACPGHPLGITATGNPSGGTFAWTISAPAADLVDGGGASVRAGATVNLRGFSPDTTTGNIPAQTASISVTYTLSGQKATANQDVTIHEIKFVVTNDTINSSPTTVVESAALLTVTFGAAATMSTDPQVEIQLDATCPRKADCAANHQVGWLQTVLTFVSDQRYTHTLIHKTPAMPVRDALPGAPAPFYSAPTPFTADKDKETAHHEDSPGTRAAWTDPRAASPSPPPAKNKQLRQVTRTESFTAWLVVQNIEWATHDPDNAFAFPGHFDWSMGVTLAVDTTQAVGSRATPATTPPTVPAKISTGKGGTSPNLKAPVANDTTNAAAVLHIDPAPGI